MIDFYVFNFVPLLVIQGITLCLLKWSSISRSLFDSLLMNCAAFLGILLGIAPQIATNGPFGIALFCTYSTLVEGLVLTLLQRHPARRTWLTVAAANLAGGVLLAVVALFALK